MQGCGSPAYTSHSNMAFYLEGVNMLISSKQQDMVLVRAYVDGIADTTLIFSILVLMKIPKLNMILKKIKKPMSYLKGKEN